jgi:hypothetical protein
MFSRGSDLVWNSNSIARRPCPSSAVRAYVCSTDRLGCTDRQVAPSGVIEPPQELPETFPGLLAYVSGMLILPPQVGVLGGVPPSTPAPIPPQAVAYCRARQLPPPQAVAFY